MITMHSIERVSERTGLNEKGAIRMILNASKKGLDYKNFNADERQYLRNRTSSEICAKYYAGYCFIFTQSSVCVTMYKVPKWFGKSRYSGKTRIRNPKKFFRKYPIELEGEPLSLVV